MRTDPQTLHHPGGMMIDLDELMRLHAAATPGPWEVKSGEFDLLR